MLLASLKNANWGILDNNNNDKNFLLMTPVCTRKKMSKVEIKATNINMLSGFCVNMFLKGSTVQRR